MPRPPTTLTQMVDTFQTPMDVYAQQLAPAFIAASQAVAGAQQRVQQALDDIRDFEDFGEEVARRLRTASFSRLPRVKVRGSPPLDRVHKLTAGPWQGLFLVSDDDTQVVGLSFSRAPHDYRSEVNELLLRYRTAPR